MQSDKRRIIIATDGSEHSGKALDVAIDLAKAFDAELVVLHVVDLSRVAVLSGGQAELIPGCLRELETEGKQIVEDAMHHAAAQVSATSRIADGTPVEQIDRVASEIHPLFIVMGTHGRTGLGRVMLGSVAEGVARHAPAPVMIVPLRGGA